MNFAAESHVDRSIYESKDFIETNIVGTYNLLESARSYWNDLDQNLKQDFRFLHISSDEVYGSLSSSDHPSNESDPYKPNSPYSASKAASDHLARAWFQTYKLPVLTVNSANNYGPYQFPEKLIPKTIIRSIKNLKVPLYGDGTQIRSWIYVDDHVRAIESLISKGISGHVYNITAYDELTNKTIVEKTLDILGKSHDMIEYVGDRPGHDKRYSIDCSKIENQIGWKHQYKFDDALKQTVDWYLQNQSWWEPLINENTLHPQPWTITWK